MIAQRRSARRTCAGPSRSASRTSRDERLALHVLHDEEELALGRDDVERRARRSGAGCAPRGAPRRGTSRRTRDPRANCGCSRLIATVREKPDRARASAPEVHRRHAARRDLVVERVAAHHSSANGRGLDHSPMLHSSAFSRARQSVFVEAVHQRAARHAEELRRLRLVARGTLERLDDALALERRELASEPAARSSGRRDLEAFEALGPDRAHRRRAAPRARSRCGARARCRATRALEPRDRLAARPRPAPGRACARDARRTRCASVAISRVRSRSGGIAIVIPLRRIEEVLAERAGARRVPSRSRCVAATKRTSTRARRERRRRAAPRGSRGRGGASPASRAASRRSRRGRACRRRPPRGGRASLVRAGERAALVAEELALEERLRERRAVDLHERPLRARRARVDRFGDDLLADAGLAEEEHRDAR